MPSFFEKLAKSALKALIKEGIDKVFQKSKNEKKETKKPKKSETFDFAEAESDILHVKNKNSILKSKMEFEGIIVFPLLSFLTSGP